MTKTRRIILLLTQIFMLMGSVLAFRNYYAISSNLAYFSEYSDLPEPTTNSTPKENELRAIILDREMTVATAAGTRQVCSLGFLLYGSLLLGGSVIHFCITPWKLKDKSKL